MKIVMNTWPAAFFNPGGGEVQLLETKAALVRKGHEVEFYNQWNPQREIDIFFQFTTLEGGSYPMWEYKRLGKKIAVSSILWTQPTDDCVNKSSPRHQQIRHIFNLADIVFTNSDMESEQLSRVFEIPRNKFAKTRNAVAAEYLAGSAQDDQLKGLFRNKFGVQGEYVLSVANIDGRKNTKLTIEACKALGLQLVLVGAVRDSHYFGECQTQFAGHFIHVGPVQDVDLLKSAYREARLFFLPSFCETPSIAALEAASQGCELVITSEGSTQEYFKDGATYINPNSLESAINGLKEGLSKKKNTAEFQAMIQREYSWDKTADDFVAGISNLK